LIGLAAGFPFAPALSAAVRARPDAPATAIGFVNMCGALTILLGVPLLGLTFSIPGGGRTGFVAVALLWGACALAVPEALTDPAIIPLRGDHELDPLSRAIKDVRTVYRVTKREAKSG